MGAGASLQVEAHSPNPKPPSPGGGQSINLLLPPSSTSTTTSFPFIGLKLSFYEDFLRYCGGRDSLQKLTTKEVVTKYILCQTFDCQLSYCDMLQRMNHPAVSSNPSVYVIHWWGETFLDVLDALHEKYSGSDKEETVLWWDIFCLNQHNSDSSNCQNQAATTAPRIKIDSQWITKILSQSMKHINRTVLVISRWDSIVTDVTKRSNKSLLPTCLMRTWCLFEIFLSAENKAELEIAMPAHMKESLLNTIQTEKSLFFNRLRDKNAIDLENSQCCREGDQRLIVDHIQATKGDVMLNNRVLEKVRGGLIDDIIVKEWMKDCMSKIPVVDKIKKQIALIELLSLQGGGSNLEQGYALCSISLEEVRNEFGECHEETVKIILLQISVLKNQGRLSEAETALTNILAKLRTLYTEKHILTLTVLSQCAELQIMIASNLKFTIEKSSKSKEKEKEKQIREKEKERRINEAETMYRSGLEVRRALLGDKDIDTLKCQHSLAMTLLLQGKLQDAVGLLQDCLAKRRMILNNYHPDTFESLRALCFASLEMGQDDIVDKLILECRDTIAKSPSWQDAPYQKQMITITFLTNLGDLYRKRQQFTKAEVIYVECLDCKMTKLSLHHPSTLSSWSDLAIFYIECERYSKAIELLSNCYDFVKKVLGFQHPFTMHCMTKLVEVYQSLLRYADALPLLERLLRCYRTHPDFGERHSVTLQTYQDIGDCYYKQDEYEKAVRFYQECYDKRKQLWGEDHPKTIAACGNLAICFEKMQRNDRAEPLFTLYYQSVKKSLGETHPKTIAIGKNLQLMRASATAPSASTVELLAHQAINR